MNGQTRHYLTSLSLLSANSIQDDACLRALVAVVLALHTPGQPAATVHLLSATLVRSKATRVAFAILFSSVHFSSMSCLGTAYYSVSI